MSKKVVVLPKATNTDHSSLYYCLNYTKTWTLYSDQDPIFDSIQQMCMYLFLDDSTSWYGENYNNDQKQK